jgi:hypothetical protein
MLTILFDEISIEGRTIEVASADGLEVFHSFGATRRIADALISVGHDRNTPVRLVRADPYLFSAPHRIDGVTLESARHFDYFGRLPDASNSNLSPSGVKGHEAQHPRDSQQTS